MSIAPDRNESIIEFTTRAVVASVLIAFLIGSSGKFPSLGSALTGMHFAAKDSGTSPARLRWEVMRASITITR